MPPERNTMSRQIADGFQSPQLADLEARVRGLELQVAQLTETVQALSQSHSDAT
jgi:hypothetical protein